MSNITDDINLNNANNIVGMSFLLNQDLVSNSIKPEIIEKNIIDNSINNDYNNKKDNFNSNPIAEYENKLNNLIYNPNSNTNAQYTNNDYNNVNNNLNSINENNYINTDDVASEFDEFDQLLKSVNNNNDTKINNDYSDNDYNDNNYNTNSINNNNQIHNQNHVNNNNYLHDDQISKAIQDEEKKIRLLEKIEILKEDLNRDGVNLNKIKNVDYNSPLDDIDQVYRILLIKNNRDRYRELAEDVILTISNSLERVFDGENEYFGMQPDLTGYSDTVRVKLRRLRYETSTIAGNVMEK
jgi:flagellar biosynthesis protein FlhF